MSLTAADVAEIMRLVEQSRFDELNLEVDGVKLRLRRAGKSGKVLVSESPAPDAAEAAATGAPRPHALAQESHEAGHGDITAPMLGIFYRSPKPGSAPFVAVGSVVDAETIVGIIEVMKLMNTVRAGVSGTISEILPADEALVEFGELLMRVRVDGAAHG